jgi:predicted O-linked N-acetylglucosamine transferase (SPINDLY family)
MGHLAPQEIAWWQPHLGGATLGQLRLEAVLQLLEHAPAARVPDAAGALYRAWIDANPTSPQLAFAWFNLGVEWARGGDQPRAILAYQQALALRPDLYQAALNMGMALEAQGQGDAAIARWSEALQPDEARIALLNNRGRLQENLGCYEEAERSLFASLLTAPDQPDVIQHWAHLRQKLCAWPVLPPAGIPGLDQAALALRSGPLGALALFDGPEMQREVGAAWLSRKIAPAPQRLAPAAGYGHARLRIGYLSSDFCRHAMSFLIAELLERHDRDQFEIYGYDSTIEDNSEIRQRVLRALDHHVPALGLDDAALARRIRADEIDILVDLNGMTKGARLHTLRWKPAPVQATWLGYIGSVPLPELDWLICDDHTIPEALDGAYAPRPLRLPGVYQANDSRMPVLPPVSRAAEGLPADAFVFCSFCNSYKITQPVFDAWLAILRQVPGSVMWLVDDNEGARRNLLAHAARHGIGPERLVFAARVEPARYLARMALGDLFLDTTPYNAGTVASDALRMGLPLLTLSGTTFASRMAGSLLRAVGMTETITESLDSYVATAVSIATDRARHAALKAALAGDAWQRSLGDIAGFTARLEDAYRRIRV